MNRRCARADHQRQGILKLAVGAIGIVFGDIGTSPIYAFRETFAGHHPIAADPLHIHGVLSLIFWSMMIVVTIKYVGIIMRADNNGEGGSLAAGICGIPETGPASTRAIRVVACRALLDDHMNFTCLQ